MRWPRFNSSSYLTYDDPFISLRIILEDIGGGFPGETHSTWNPTEIDPDDEEEEEDEGKEENEGLEENAKKEDEDEDEGDHFMYFTEIATKVAPMLDEMFPPESGVRLIAEPGRYFVAAAATLVASVVACRHNGLGESFEPYPFLKLFDKQVWKQVLT